MLLSRRTPNLLVRAVFGHFHFRRDDCNDALNNALNFRPASVILGLNFWVEHPNAAILPFRSAGENRRRGSVFNFWKSAATAGRNFRLSATTAAAATADWVVRTATTTFDWFIWAAAAASTCRRNFRRSGVNVNNFFFFFADALAK
jgi:hypothetical protein